MTAEGRARGGLTGRYPIWIVAAAAIAVLSERPRAEQSLPADRQPAPTTAETPSSPATPPFPLAPGTWWEYRETYTEYLPGIDASYDDRTRFVVTGSRQRPFLFQSGGFDPVSGPIEIGESFVLLAPWTGELALPLPLEVGRSGPAVEGARETWSVEAEDEVSVPAGTFKAVRCAFRTRQTVSLLWIAPGVGIVREAQGEPHRKPEIERVLLRWGPR